MIYFIFSFLDVNWLAREFGVSPANLSPEERQTLPKMSMKGLDFVEKTLRYGEEHSVLQIPYVDIGQMRRDLTLKKQVQRILGVLEPLCEKLRRDKGQATKCPPDAYCLFASPITTLPKWPTD